MEDLSKKIKEVFNNNNYNLLEPIEQNINAFTVTKKKDEKLQFIKNLNLNDYEKLLFYLEMSESKIISPSTIQEVFNYSIVNFINNNINSLINLLSNKKIMDTFIFWFRKNIIYNKISSESLVKILKLSEIQSNILFDMKFWDYKMPYELFESLPQELGYMIAFYFEHDIKTYSANLEKLYNKYYSNYLTEKDRINLLKEEIKINRKSDIFHMNNNDKMYQFLYCLKQIMNDKNYYNNLINIQNRSGLTFEEIVKFAYKYDSTIFFKKLCSNELDLNIDMINKIKYLSKADKIKVIDVDMENTSLEDLKIMPKELSSVKMNLLGGPHATYSNKMFKDGYNSEVRRIDLNGDVKICNATAYDHESALKDLYSDIDFEEKFSSAYEKALEVLKKTSSITFLIENNTCLILLSNKITNEQRAALNMIMNDNNIISKENNLYGITVYDEDNNVNSFAYEGSSVSLEDAINFINSLEIKEKAITR